MNTLYIVILLAIYITCALTFFLYMFMIVAPKRTTESTTKQVRKLFTDPEFVRETTTLTRKLTVEEVTKAIVPALNEKFVAILEGYDFGIDDDFFTSVGHHVTEHLNTWWARKSGEAKKAGDVAAGEMNDAVALASINQGNPQALEAISGMMGIKNPFWKGVFQLMSLRGASELRKPPGQGGQGGY